MKRVKNIEDKKEELLKTTKNKTENIKQITDFIKEPLSPEAENLIKKLKPYKKMLITEN